MADLWYPSHEDGRRHLPVEVSSEGLRRMRTLCGREAIVIGEGVPLPEVRQAERCWSCLLRHGGQLADERESIQPTAGASNTRVVEKSSTTRVRDYADSS